MSGGRRHAAGGQPHVFTTYRRGAGRVVTGVGAGCPPPARSRVGRSDSVSGRRRSIARRRARSVGSASRAGVARGRWWPVAAASTNKSVCRRNRQVDRKGRRGSASVGLAEPWSTMDLPRSAVSSTAGISCEAPLCSGLVSFIPLLGGVQARTQRTLPNQALDCVDHKHGPNRKLDQIPVENPVSITGGSGSYPHR